MRMLVALGLGLALVVAGVGIVRLDTAAEPGEARTETRGSAAPATVVLAAADAAAPAVPESVVPSEGGPARVRFASETPDRQEISADPAPAGPQAAVLTPLDPATLPQGVARDFDRTVFRQRFAAIDVAAIRRVAAQERITLALFDDARFDVVVDEVVQQSPDGSRLTWTGHVAGTRAPVTVAVVDEAVSASIQLEDGALFEITRAADGAHRVQERNEAALPGCAADDANAEMGPGRLLDPLPGVPNPPPVAGDDTVDVMVLYTARAAASLGGTAGTEARIAALVAGTNQAYAGSSTNQRIRLVHAQEVAYSDAAIGLGTALDQMTDPGDGILDFVDDLRDQVGADMVSFVVGPLEPDACGVGWVPFAFAPVTQMVNHTYSVIASVCTGSSRTFAHELAHNQGAYHDPATSRGQGMSQAEIDAVPAPYSFGYIAPGDAFHTIMAYGSTCGFCPGLLAFSNPQLDYQGAPIGNARSNVAGTLEATHADIQSFRVPSDGGAPPPATTALAPSGTVMDALPAFSWTAVSNASWYGLGLDDGDGSPEDVVWVTADQAGCATGTGTCSVVPIEALSAGAHRFRVQTWNDRGTGPWSPRLSFVVELPAGVPMRPVLIPGETPENAPPVPGA